MHFTLQPGKLTLANLRKLSGPNNKIQLAQEAHAIILAAEKTVADIIAQDKTVYGINTGFGALANTKIKKSDLQSLQLRLVLSHATGVGEYLSEAVVRLLLLLKINSLARGFSGVRLQTIETLIALYNGKCYPCIPAKGSVGASGDLAPLAHLTCALIGEGKVRYEGKIMAASDALERLNLTPLKLAPKEGLALLNGTQVSTALALYGLFQAENIFYTALVTGALSVDAVRASDTPFDERIQNVRGFREQSQVAAWLRSLLDDSAIRKSHAACHKVQDPYSLRCQPQVMGACLSLIHHAAHNLLIEANAVSDNPLVFADTDSVLSGGNFHAQPVAFAADTLALSLAEISSITERRIALLMDPQFSGLPAFLVKDAGLNSGFMIAHVTAAALTSENKSLAHPASIDSIPTSANQEDHVSMATYAARRLQDMADNAAVIMAIELLSACQGIDFLRPLKSSNKLEAVHDLVREQIEFYKEDRLFAPDIEKAKALIQSGKIATQIHKTSLETMHG